RFDYITLNNLLTFNKIDNEAAFSFELTKFKNNRLRVNATYRNSQYLDSSRNRQSENLFAGSIEYVGRFFKNAIILSSFYEAGSGLEQKREFSYLKVAAGQGTHVWRDYNGNGVEELDEFEVAQFQDEANYIKILLNTQEFVQTYFNRFTLTLSIRPANVWRSKTGFLHFLSRFANVSSFAAAQKNSNERSASAFNPFRFNLNDSSLLSSNLNLINTLSFNQLSNYFGIDFLVQKTQHKDLLYYGAESNALNSQEVSIRTNPHKSLTINTDYTHSIRKTESLYMNSRNMNIENHQIENSLLVQVKQSLFCSVGYILKYKYNRKEGVIKEKSIHHQLVFDFNYRMAKKGNVIANLQYIRLLSNAESNSTLGYEMLEGLKVGNNILWMAGYQASITNYLQIELSYNGRSTSGNRVIHTGNIQLKAQF
ncbi:MAG: hypothetical protein LBU51_07045, partial [Bacteroidales bacterium]|nr:hypothetical protein [Bacteroidales bacterium]